MARRPPLGVTPLQLKPTSLTAGVEGQLVFQIAGPNGKTPEGFAVEQTKPLYLIVVRSDLTGYQHLHPVARGRRYVVHTDHPSERGQLRVIADFTPIAGGANQVRTVLGDDLMVAGVGTDRPLPAASKTANVDGYTVTLTGDLAAGESLPLTFSIAKAGQPVDTLEPYLGAFGHLVALRQSDVAYTHLHPSTDLAPGATAGPTIGICAVESYLSTLPPVPNRRADSYRRVHNVGHLIRSARAASCAIRRGPREFHSISVAVWTGCGHDSPATQWRA